MDAFFPYFFWLFARDFPRTAASYRMRRWLRWGARAALVVGFALFAWQLVRLGRALGGLSGAESLAAAAPGKPSYEQYIPLMVLTILGLGTLFWKARKATGDERRRALLFAAAIALALLPVFLHIVAFLVPPLRPFLAPEAVGPVQAAFVPVCFLSLPFTTAYAVLVYKVLNVKLLARGAVQYALARGTALVVIFLPLAVLLVYFYLHSDEPLRESMTGNRLLLVLCSLAGVAALVYGARILEAIDRRFFREQYDARKILTQLADRIRWVHDAKELAELTCREVDRALHLEACSVLVEEQRTAQYVDPLDRRRKIDASSPLALLIAESVELLEIDPEEPAAALGRPQGRSPLAGREPAASDRPHPGAGRNPPWGHRARGREERPPFPQGGQASVARHRRFGARGGAIPAGGGTGGRERAGVPEVRPRLPRPHRLLQRGQPAAGGGARPLRPAAQQVPLRAPDRRRRHGAGLPSLRPVARPHGGDQDPAPHLPRACAHPAARGARRRQGGAPAPGRDLRRGHLAEEPDPDPRAARRRHARAADRAGALAPCETVELGIAMAGALERLHAAGILHRDVKPNNIGFTRDGVPKLMDFGIARRRLDTRIDDSSASSPSGVWLEETERTRP